MQNYTNTKIKRTMEPASSSTNKSKHRVILNQTANRKYDGDAVKSLTRKSIDVTLGAGINKPNSTTYYQSGQGKAYYRRGGGHNFKKQSLGNRYQQEDREREVTRVSSKSPYIRGVASRQDKDAQGKSSSLNKSTHKMRSGQLLKQNSPRYLFYRQPRSSLSQHYDPTIQTSLHKRRTSAVTDQKSTPIEQAKELYKNSEYSKAIDLLKRYVKMHKTSIEAHYLLGMSLINNNEFSPGIESLVRTLQIDGNYKRSLYLVIALAYKKLGKFDNAIDILNKGLILYPQYYDCLVYRGKLHLKKENYFHALKDFTAAIELNKAKGFAYLGKGMCEKELGHFDQAIETLTAGSNTTDMGKLCLEKRGIIYYQQGKYSLAMCDLESCQSSSQSSTAHYYKGLIFYKQGRAVDSLLCFQQALKADNHRQNVTASVQMMMRIKIEQKDFYEAYHILTRSDNVEVDTQALNQWRLFLEGSLFLMKKKYKEGINTFQTLLKLSTFKGSYTKLKTKLQKQRYKFIKPLVHLYKGYGQLCQSSMSNAQKEYKEYEVLCEEFGQSKDNLSKGYNQLIMQVYQQRDSSCQGVIQEAIGMIPNKPEPYLYLAFDIIHHKFQEQTDPLAKNRLLEQAIQNLSIAITHLPQLSNNHISTFFYFRAILQLYRNDFNKAVGDVDKAIEKSQDNIPKYFYLRGLIFAVFGNFSQAVQDLTVAINLDEKYGKPYLQRAKCLQIEGNSNEAFLDLQRYITLAPEDHNIHKYAGYLLFQNCAYEDCLSAFSHGAETDSDSELILTKAKCHFLLGQDQLSIPLFQKYCELSYSSQYQSDVTMMQICQQIRPQTAIASYSTHLATLDKLINSKNEDDCKIFKLRDMHQLKASIYLLMNEYQASIQQFEKTLELFNDEKLKQKEKHFIDDSEQFEDQWSQVEIKYNMSICLLCQGNYAGAKNMLSQFDKSSQKGRNWNIYMTLINNLIEGHNEAPVNIDTFEQNHRISKQWPRIQIPNAKASVSMAFSYPFVEPPELLPEFDHSFFQQFQVSKSEMKPQAPWINRCDGGLIFTPNIQTYQNLELSMTTTKKDGSQRGKPVSEMEKSLNMSQSDIQLQSEELKKKFKLDSMIEMKLKRLMDKK